MGRSRQAGSVGREQCGAGKARPLMPRQRAYASNAERQAAYRARLAERARLAGSGQLIARFAELEAAHAAAVRRAEAAEARAARAEHDATVARDRDADLLASRPAW